MIDTEALLSGTIMMMMIRTKIIYGPYWKCHTSKTPILQGRVLGRDHLYRQFAGDSHLVTPNRNGEISVLCVESVLERSRVRLCFYSFAKL